MVETPWYKCGYAASAKVLFEGVGRMIDATFAAIFDTGDQTDVFAVLMVFIVVAIVAGLLSYQKLDHLSYLTFLIYGTYT